MKRNLVCNSPIVREKSAALSTRKERNTKADVKGLTPYIKKSSKVLISTSDISKVDIVPFINAFSSCLPVNKKRVATKRKPRPEMNSRETGT